MALWLLVTGCTSGRTSPVGPVDASGLPTDRPVTRSDLLGYPESRIRYPDSRLVAPVGSDQTPTHPGEEPNPAYVGGIFTVRSTATQLYRWFGLRLAQEGFVPAADYRPATETSGRAWQRFHRVQVQVGVLDPARLRTDQGILVSTPPGTIAYEEVVVGYAPGLPKV